MGGGVRRFGVGGITVAAIFAPAACYPTFQFDGDGAGGETASGTGESASSGVRPSGGASTTSATTSSTATTAGNTTSTVNTSTTATASSSGSGISAAGAPCDVPEVMACTSGQICCFELSSMPTDTCVATCEIDQDGDFFRDHVSLGCNEDSDCAGGACCIQYTIGGNLRGTYCQSSCDLASEDQACDPLGGGCAGGSCASLLDDEYGGGAPPPPYDRYGICQ